MQDHKQQLLLQHTINSQFKAWAYMNCRQAFIQDRHLINTSINLFTLMHVVYLALQATHTVAFTGTVV